MSETKRQPVVRHHVARKPEHPEDTSGALCVQAGDVKPRPLRPGRPRHGWTLDVSKVTCPRCLEWMHA